MANGKLSHHLRIEEGNDEEALPSSFSVADVTQHFVS